MVNIFNALTFARLCWHKSDYDGAQQLLRYCRERGSYRLFDNSLGEPPVTRDDLFNLGEYDGKIQIRPDHVTFTLWMNEPVISGLSISSRFLWQTIPYRSGSYFWIREPSETDRMKLLLEFW